MYPIPGHVAMSLAGAYWLKLPYAPAIVATIAVDVIDKVLVDVWAVTPYGRCWFHTLLSVAVCSLIVGKWKGKKWGLSWMVGHTLHLVGDIGFIPWFYPFIPYEWPAAPNMVEASVLGAKELSSGFLTGHWIYSEQVLNVFYPKLLLLELLMLIAASGWLVTDDPKWKRLKWPLLAGFLIFTACRLLYDFPAALTAVSSVAGDWVLL